MKNVHVRPPSANEASGGASNETETIEAPRLYIFRGRACCLAAELGRVLGYAREGRKLVHMIRRAWRNDMRQGHDFEILTGDALIEFRRLDTDPVPRAPSLTILYEPGIDRVCLLTDKPIGRKLRDLLVDKVLPALRAGAPALPASPLPEAPQLPEPHPHRPQKQHQDQDQKDPTLPEQGRASRLLDAAEVIMDMVEADLSLLRRIGSHPSGPIPMVPDTIMAGITMAYHLIAAGEIKGMESRVRELRERRLRLSKQSSG